MSTATLPKALRESMHIKAGQQLELIPMGAIIQLVPKITINALRGIARDATPEQYRDITERL